MTLYQIVEFDANDIPTPIYNHITKNEARKTLKALREIAREKQLLFRYIMRRQPTECKYDHRTGSHLWTGNLEAEDEMERARR